MPTVTETPMRIEAVPGMAQRSDQNEGEVEAAPQAQVPMNRFVRPTPPSYKIHDNGGIVQTVYDFPHPPQNETPYVAIMNGEKVYDDMDATVVQYQRLFVGMDPAYPGFGDGNTILLQLAPHTYYFIAGRASRIFQIPDTEEIVRYESPIGNNDVPYPYAVSQSHMYLMIANGRGDLSQIANVNDWSANYDFGWSATAAGWSKYWPEPVPQPQQAPNAGSSSNTVPAVRSAVRSAEPSAST